ncbi:MAG: conjugal transfer protein TraG N-terminal domain-containing protein, partial [Pseudomonadota bacterium]|nr:conjugal transfer protein TraG N-terminal domain-containing protein [Pseudomonadota bacterium]
MGNEIYCYGGIDIYNAVFNAIAMMNGDRSFMQSLVAVGVLVGGFWTMVTLIFGDFIKPFLHWIIPMAVLQAAFLTPTATVQLIDVVQEDRHEVVDNVPYGLALIAGSLSRISQRITEKTELYFHSVNDIKYSKTGGIFAANLVGNQKLMTIQDEDFADNMRSFIGQCVLYDLALGRKYTMKQLRNTHDIWGLISANASPARSFMWKERGNRGDILTCAEGVQRFNASWGAHVDQTACAVGAKIYPNHDASPYTGGVQGRSFYRTGMCKSPLARNEFIKFLPFQYAALAGIGQQAPEILKQQMMISAIVDAQDHASAVVGNMPNFAARKAYFQQRSSYENIGLLAADTLPIMRAVLELICYAIFLFIVPILVLPMGYKVLISWTQTVLWLAMWPPMYAVLHLIMVSAIAMKTKAFVGISNSAGITIASSLGVQNISADMAAMAGYLSMSIPFICIAVVKGVSSFVHMAGSLGAVSQGAATSAATEALTGNYSLGNTSMDNHSFGNMNQLSQSYNSNLSTGNTSLQEGHSTYATDAHGNMVAKEQRHDLGVSVNMAKSLSDQKRMSAVQEQSMGQSLTQSSENILSSAVEKMGNFGKTLSNTT